jgi:hypothetical protein
MTHIVLWYADETQKGVKRGGGVEVINIGNAVTRYLVSIGSAACRTAL